MSSAPSKAVDPGTGNSAEDTTSLGKSDHSACLTSTAKQTSSTLVSSATTSEATKVNARLPTTAAMTTNAMTVTELAEDEALAASAATLGEMDLPTVVQGLEGIAKAGKITSAASK